MFPKKQPSGFEKRKKKQRLEQLAQSQKGALEKFLTKKVKSSCSLESQHQTPHLICQLNDHDGNDINDNINLGNKNENDENQLNDHNVFDMNDNENLGNEIEQPTPHLDIYDPRIWANLDNKMIDILVEKGPIREPDLIFPLNSKSRHFSYSYYTRKLPNGEIQDRKWLVYSKHVDKVFCFCCKLFKSMYMKSLLAHEGFDDWKHVSERLREHENSIEHITNMSTWIDLQIKLKKNETIDKNIQEQIIKKKNGWK